MRRIGDISDKISQMDNYMLSFYYASKHKHKRYPIINFEKHLESNLTKLLHSYQNSTFRTSEYKFMDVFEPKHRLIGMLPFADHVQHWAMLNVIEDDVTKSFNAYTYGGIKKRGPHKYMRAIRSAITQHPNLTRYLLCDIHHFYPTVNHGVLKEKLRSKIKDAKLLSTLDEIVDSVPGEVGMYPGTKLAQFFSLVYTYQFDHDIKRCFYIFDSPKLVEYYTQRYISERIANAKSREDYEDLSKGIQFLSEKFRSYLHRIDFCYRLADDVLILHHDSTFLHFILEWIGLYYAAELNVELNKKWKVGLISEGIDTGGYVHFPTHVRSRKRNKVALCRQVAKFRKLGLSDEQIRLRVSSRLGFVGHADVINLFKKLRMETKRKRLGSVISKKKSPWPDMTTDRKVKFDEILYDTRLPEEQRGSEEDKLIVLTDYKIEDSKIEKDSDGAPKKCLVIRYRWKGEEHYSFTGSAVLIDQALTDFSHDDLPVDTVIKVLTNKFGKKFFRFT